MHARESAAFLERMSASFAKEFQQRKVILSFDEYLALVQQNPRQHVRNAVSYLLNAFDHFGERTQLDLLGQAQQRFQIFDFKGDRSGPIIGGEHCQSEFYRALRRFEREGLSSKLILFHGPNGSAKSSTVDAIANALQRYSQLEAGAVYCFHWVFPTEKTQLPHDRADIGFAKARDLNEQRSFAHLEEHKLASRIPSEFRENPLYLLPMPHRENFLRQAMGKKEFELPAHILIGNGLSKRNQQIFEVLLNAYAGSLSAVLRHVQVERFFFSKPYRIGISTIEPQMSIDAVERQLTMDKNYANLPSILQTLSFYQSSGDLVDANRGLLEFSDLLKRPVEAFKYLLSAIEKASINLGSGTAVLDTVFVATTNEKHLDAFKTIPDFSSFKGRFDLVKVPYLLNARDEARIYERDIEVLRKSKTLCPHALETLCAFAVLTRLKMPNPELFKPEYRELLRRLDPLAKMKLYQGDKLAPAFTKKEETTLREVLPELVAESQDLSVYEGRFGASPREIRSILHRAALSSAGPDLTAVDVLSELQHLVRDKTVYEFLQFEPRSHYHDVDWFIEVLQDEFVRSFEIELVSSMAMAKDAEYDKLLGRYVTHVVAAIKGKKIWDEITGSYLEPSPKLMDEVENILQGTGPKAAIRDNLLSRIASYKIDNPEKEIHVVDVFPDFLELIKEHFFKERQKNIDANVRTLLLYSETPEDLKADEKEAAAGVFRNMEALGYSSTGCVLCLKFLLKRKMDKAEAASAASSGGGL